MSETKSFQNAFDLELMQSFMWSLDSMGLAVQTFSETTLGGDTTYAAVIMPKDEFEDKILMMNGLRRLRWPEECQYMAVSGQGTEEFIEEEALDQETAAADPRYISGASAWAVLSRSAEIACKLWDGALEEEYFSLDDTSGRFSEILTDGSLQPLRQLPGDLRSDEPRI